MRLFISWVLLGLLAGQGGGQPDWSKTDTETLDVMKLRSLVMADSYAQGIRLLESIVAMLTKMF